MNDNDKAVSIIEPGQLARVSPMDALALMSDEEFRARLNARKLSQQRMAIIQRELMDVDVDYGVIPGTGTKPTLLKPGAEKLCNFHRLIPTFEQETILGDGVFRPHLRVLSKCALHYESKDGPIVGEGLGAANSWEKKYRWREGQRRCPSCGAASIFRSKHADKDGDTGWYCWAKRGGCGAQFKENSPEIASQQLGQVENPDPFDGENTLEKMAAKRSQTDATLRATATSGLFTQDVEDMPEAEVSQTPRPAAAQTRTQAPPKTNGHAEPPKTAAKAVAKPTANDDGYENIPHCVKCGQEITEYTFVDASGKERTGSVNSVLLACQKFIPDKRAHCYSCMQEVRHELGDRAAKEEGQQHANFRRDTGATEAEPFDPDDGLPEHDASQAPMRM